MFQHEVTHFHTKGKRFGVNSHVQLTTKFLTQTPTKFLKAFCICIVNPLALGFLLLLLGLLGAFLLLLFLSVVAQLGLISILVKNNIFYTLVIQPLQICKRYSHCRKRHSLLFVGCHDKVFSNRSIEFMPNSFIGRLNIFLTHNQQTVTPVYNNNFIRMFGFLMAPASFFWSRQPLIISKQAFQPFYF